MIPYLSHLCVQRIGTRETITHRATIESDWNLKTFLMTTSNESTENWYDYKTDLISKFMNANAKFVNGDIADKKEILVAIGQNPVLLDGKLQITPNEWLMPLRDNTKRFVEQFEQVRTMSQQMKTFLPCESTRTPLGNKPRA